jgi:D-amino-acid dehydrogenase
MMSHDVLIIGGGIIGLCTARELAGRGWKVTLVDRRERGGNHCAIVSAGMVTPSHFVPLAAPGMIRMGLKWMWNPESPFWVKPRLSWDLLTWGWFFNLAATRSQVERMSPLLRDLHLESRAWFEQFAETSGRDFGFRKCGILMMCRTKRVFAEEGHAAVRARELGIPAEVLDPAQTAARDPSVTMTIAGSVSYPLDCMLDPQKFSDAIEADVAVRGVEWIGGCEVRQVNARGRRIVSVTTSVGELAADEYVICGGAWSSALVKPLGLRVPLQAGKGYSLTLANPRQLPAIGSIFVEDRVAVTPLPGGRLRFGGTMEIGGLDTSIDSRRVRGIIKSVPRYFPQFRESDFNGLVAWSGLRPCSADGLPYLGRFTAFDNLSCATGHGMLGLSLAPITAQLMAEVLAGERPSIDIGALAPDRYG